MESGNSDLKIDGLAYRNEIGEVWVSDKKGYIEDINSLPSPALDYVLKCSHTFNLLEARGVISVTERTAIIGRIRKLARQVAEAWLEERKSLGFPLLRDE